MCVCPNMKQICFSGIFITATVLCFVSDVCTATFYSDNLKFQVLDTKNIYSTVEETSSSKPEDRSKIWNKVPTILQMAFKILYFFWVFWSKYNFAYFSHFRLFLRWKHVLRWRKYRDIFNAKECNPRVQPKQRMWGDYRLWLWWWLLGHLQRKSSWIKLLAKIMLLDKASIW